MSFTPSRVQVLCVLAAAACSEASSDAPEHPRVLMVAPEGLALADELVIVPRAGMDDLDALAAELGAEHVWRAPRTGALALRFASPQDAEAARAALAGDRRVRELRPAAVVRAAAAGTGIGTSPGGLPGLQWNLPALGLAPGLAPLSAAGVRVAVLDSGVAYEDFSDALGSYALAGDLAATAFAPGYDFVNDDDHPNDDEGHGTHVAGVMAASSGIVAVASGLEILPVKVLDADNLGTELALAEGIRYAVDHGARVINMSLAFPPGYVPSRFLQDAVDYASANGVVMIAAVGNDGARQISYPAAFRDVIAVGATGLRHGYSPRGDGVDRWWRADRNLQPLGYSNRGALVDLAAPAGTLDGDADGDGLPEAVLAQTFAPGDPTALGYYFYAGTSQAAAQVSGVVAAMLARNPALTPGDVRALLGDTARAVGFRALDDQVGRGMVRAADAVAWADTPWAEWPRPRFYAAIHLRVREQGATGRRAIAEVEVVDERGEPARFVEVYGTFSGGATGTARVFTDYRGFAELRSERFDAGEPVVAFQVDAVVSWWEGAVDRPRGLIRIDSLSLELLAAFADEVGGGELPIALAVDAELAGRHDVPTVSLLNFSWALATVPMAVVVDRAWYETSFEGAEDRVVTSRGTGIGTSPIFLDPGSFPRAVALDYAEAPPRAPLVITTFAAAAELGEGARPVFADDDAIPPELLDALWSYAYGEVTGTGIGTSPVFDPSWGVSPVLFGHLTRAVRAYADFGLDELATPVEAYPAVLRAAETD